MATGDLTSPTIVTETNGMTYLSLTLTGMATGGTWAFGMGTDNDPSAAKVVLTVTSPGFDAAGATTTVTRTVYGTRVMRKAYPSDASDDVTTSGSDAVAHVALSDFIYSGDTVTIAVAAGLYTASAVPSNALTGGTAVTNSSTNAHAKPVGRFVSVPYQRVTGDFAVEYFGGHRSARNGKPLACVVFTATDQHAHTSTTTVTGMTLATANASGIALPVYAATIDTSGFTDGDTITVNAKAYPWVGDAALDSDTAADGVAQPDERLGPMANLLDRAGTNLPPLYVVVDSATGSDSTGVASTTLATAEASRVATIGGAKTKAAAIRANGENVVIYLVDNGGTGYGFNGSSNAWSQATPARVWTTIAPHPTLGTRAGAKIVSGNNTVANGKLRFSGLTVNSASSGQFRGTATTGQLWLDGCTVTLSSSSSTYVWQLCFATDCTVLNMAQGFMRFSTSRAAWKLFRGNDLTGVAASTAVDLYCVVANKGDFWHNVVGNSDPASQHVSDNAVCAYNRVPAFSHASRTWLDTDFDTNAQGTPRAGLLVACNAVRKSNGANSGPLFRVIGDHNVASGDNCLLWHNAISAATQSPGRTNLGYNSTGTAGYTRVNWSMVGNNFDGWNNKDDTFASDGGASGSRTGAWTVGYELGGRCNVMEDSSGFLPMFNGLHTKFGTANSYTDAANGDLTPASDSPSRSLIPANLSVLPYDLDGNPFDDNGGGTAGAYQYAADVTPDTPSVSPSATPNPVTGTTTTLAANLTGGTAPYTYAWSGTGMSFSNSAVANPTATFTAAGTYTASLTVTDANAATGSGSVVITVSQTLTAIAVSPASVSLASGNDATFSASGVDQFGAAMSITPVWSKTGGPTIDSSTGVATGANTTVKAVSGSVTGTATITGGGATLIFQGGGILR